MLRLTESLSGTLVVDLSWGIGEAPKAVIDHQEPRHAFSCIRIGSIHGTFARMVLAGTLLTEVLCSGSAVTYWVTTTTTFLCLPANEMSLSFFRRSLWLLMFKAVDVP